MPSASTYVEDAADLLQPDLLATDIAENLRDARTQFEDVADALRADDHPARTEKSLALAVVLVRQPVLSRTVFGRHMVAVGTDEEAVRLSGIDPRPTKVTVFDSW